MALLDLFHFWEPDNANNYAYEADQVIFHRRFVDLFAKLRGYKLSTNLCSKIPHGLNSPHARRRTLGFARFVFPTHTTEAVEESTVPPATRQVRRVYK